MKAAVISLGSKSSQWVAESMRKLFDEVDELDIRKVEVYLTSQKLEVFYEGKPLTKYDCIYAKGSFRYIDTLRTVTTALHKKCYMPISPEAVTIANDKFLSQLVLQENKVPMPRGYIAPTSDAAKAVLEKLNYPIVIKLPHGTHGKGVMFADTYAAAASLIDALSALREPYIIQEFIDNSGVDYRLLVVGNKVVASMKRTSTKEEKRANIHVGGEGVSFEPTQSTKQVALDAARAIGADVCAVDIMDSYKGPLVLEVNLYPGLQGISKATNLNIAEKIAKYLYQRTKDVTESDKKSSTKSIFQDLGIENTAASQEIITNLDFRGMRMLLPEVVTKTTGIADNTEVAIKMKKGKFVIEEFDVSKI